MNIITLPELFYLISTKLNDKEKIFLTSSSKITYKFKSLIKLDLEYNLEVCDKWNVKNVLIKKFTSESKIKELIENSILESIAVNSKYVKFISNNTNIKLLNNDELIEKLVSCGCNYMVMKIMLNNNESVDNINKQFLESSKFGYLDVIKLLIDLGADVRVHSNCAIILASRGGYLSVVKLLIDCGANVRAQSNRAIILASLFGHLSVIKLLIENGANIRVLDNRALFYAKKNKHLDVIKFINASSFTC